jgi:hypothetical protein
MFFIAIASCEELKYIGRNYECLFIDDTTAYFEANAGTGSYRHTRFGDSIVLFPLLLPPAASDPYYRIANPNDYGYCFRIVFQDKDSITLRPYRSRTHGEFEHYYTDDYLYDSTCTTTFYSYPFYANDSFSFEGLSYETRAYRTIDPNTGFVISVEGKSKAIHLPEGKYYFNERVYIDSLGNVYLFRSKDAAMFTSLLRFGNKHGCKPGYFQGQISDSIISEMATTLQNCGLGYLRLKTIEWDDKNSYILDVYYNKSQRHTTGNRFPLSIRNIHSHLESLRKSIDLAPSKEAQAIFERLDKGQH